MKILTKNNGIAMVAVMAVLVIVTLFIPVMFNMGDSALAMAVTGMDQQRASYLARSSVEMTVAAFKQSYNEFIEKVPSATAPEGETPEEKAIREDRFEVFNAYKYLGIMGKDQTVDKTGAEAFYQQNPNSKTAKIAAEPVYMYVSSVDQKEYKYDYVKAAEKTFDGVLYKYVGTANCSFGFDNSDEYYKVYTDDNGHEVLYQYPSEPDNNHDGVPDDYHDDYEAIETKLNNNESVDYSLSKVSNRNVTFTAEAKVNGKTVVRRCIVVLPTYPSEEGWIYFNGTAEPGENPKIAKKDNNGIDIITSGCNQAQFLPNKRTGMTSLNYSEAGVQSSDYKAQVLQIYSCLGNMIISSVGIKDGTGIIGKETVEEIKLDEQIAVNNGVEGSEFVLGVSPPLNTSPNDDPNYNIFDGINAASYQSGVQKDNFIAATATNAIRVDLPVQLFVNPARANRLGDGFDKNKTIYKVMIFQAPTIYFSRRVDMMISLYNNDTKDGVSLDSANAARRMSSVVLAAPSNTPYSYYNKDRNCAVKAGKVFFAEDCYLWVINYGDNGSGYSEHWYEVASTVYYRDSDFTKVKIASAGDVYYYNTEVPLDATDTNSKKIGLPLSGWALETIYYKNYNALVTNQTPWWRLWTRSKQALFGEYINGDGIFGLLGMETKNMFVEDDFHKVGNVYTDSSIEIPEIADFYTVWEN